MTQVYVTLIPAPLHGYFSTLDTVFHINTCYTGHSHFISMYHCHTNTVCMPAMIVFVFPLHWTLFMLHGLLLHEYSCIPVTWLFSVTDIDIYCYWTWMHPVTDIDILIIGHVTCWYAMCGTKCHVDPSHGATSRIPQLSFPIFRYLVSCFQQSSCHIIVLHVPCTVLILIHCVL